MKIAIGRVSSKKRLEIFQNRNITNILLYFQNRNDDVCRKNETKNRTSLNSRTCMNINVRCGKSNRRNQSYFSKSSRPACIISELTSRAGYCDRYRDSSSIQMDKESEKCRLDIDNDVERIVVP